MEILEFTELNPVTFRMKIRVDAKALSSEFEKALDELAKDANIPGFRPGKAPRNVVKNHVGSDEIWRMARDRSVIVAFEEALRDQGSSCIAKPDYQHRDYKGEGDYEVTIIFHPEPPSPEELLKKDKERKFEKKGPDDHLPEHLKPKPLEEHQRRMRQGPTIEYSEAWKPKGVKH